MSTSTASQAPVRSTAATRTSALNLVRDTGLVMTRELRPVLHDPFSLVFGMIQYEGDPKVVVQMLADAPAPVRWLVPRLSRRAFRRHARRLHGTATP